jgi:DNA-binding transcriptional LysR family regulator
VYFNTFLPSQDLDLVKKTENEIACSDDVVIRDVYIGAGETDGMRLPARAAGSLKKLYPGIHYHISSGNSVFVKEQLDKGLIDFGIIFATPDTKKYEVLKLPSKDIWGVLMRKDSPLAEKESVSPEDLWDQPLLISQQETEGGRMSRWMKRRLSELNIIMTYNLLFNASLLVEEGLGYAVCFDRIINTSGDSRLCFRLRGYNRETAITNTEN